MLHRTTEWLNANSYRRFPFVDGTSMVPDGWNKTQGLPDDMLLDFQALITDPALHTAGATARLKRLLVNVAWIDFVFEIGYLSFTLRVPELGVFPYRVHASAYGGRCQATFGRGCLAIMALGSQDIRCDIPLEPALTMDQTRCRVDSLTNRSLIGRHDPLTGTIYVEPGYNCDPVVADGVIRLVAALGIGAGRYCAPMVSDIVSCKDALLRINGQSAGPDGNIDLVVLGAKMTADPATHTITISAPSMADNAKCG